MKTQNFCTNLPNLLQLRDMSNSSSSGNISKNCFKLEYT